MIRIANISQGNSQFCGREPVGDHFERINVVTKANERLA